MSRRKASFFVYSSVLFLSMVCVLALAGCGGSGAVAALPSNPTNPQPPTPPPPPTPAHDPLIVNSLDDADQPATGIATLRSALAHASSTDKITFDPSLDGKVINLSIVGENHTKLKGETYSGMTFQGYALRDYGRSALFAQKNVTIDASALPHGVTIAWTGGDANAARVLAVYGDLTLTNVTITGGFSKAEQTNDTAQPYTLARGGGIAVWGIAALERCTIAGNKILGDANASRDRGTYGGGIYANGLEIQSSVISGNTAVGYGAAGGGIYSVGGADHISGTGNDTFIYNSAITGNKVTAQHAYGGGIFTLSGGPVNLAVMHITNSTIARNLVEAPPNVTPFYFRGGGIYMGGGGLDVASTTIAENQVNGTEKLISGKPNMGGGGIAATIGDAHVVEDLSIRHSIVVGNKMNGAAADVFTGSLISFTSRGYNLIGAIDFSQILVPIPDAMSLSRKHYPKVGDHDAIVPSDVLDLSAPQLHDSVPSAGTDAGQKTVLWYLPSGAAVDQIPYTRYNVNLVSGGYTGWGAPTDDFLNNLLLKLRTDYSTQLGSDFGSSFGDLTGVTFYGPARSWPSNTLNLPWITFWRNLDSQIGNRLGTAILADDFWGTFASGPTGNVTLDMRTTAASVQVVSSDQRGQTRSPSQLADIGAIER